MNDVNELKKKALAGDLSALEELRRRGILSGKQRKYSMAPLSYAQRRLWFIDKMDHSPAYNLPAFIVLEGKLNVGALENAFREIIRRHEILRTSFVESEGMPFQKILEHLDFNLPVIDLSCDTSQQETIRSLIQNEIHRCFNLSDAPLLFCQLLKSEEEKHLLLFNMHHIISDGWSVNILISELNLLYNLFCKGFSNTLPPLKFQYKDYVQRHEQLLLGKESEEHKRFWLEKLSGETEVTELPPDLKRPLHKTFNGRLHKVEIPVAISSGIKELISRNGVSLFMFFISTVNILLNKYTGKTWFIVGAPVSGREIKDTADQIGLYVNTIPLRVDTDVSSTFNEFLEQVKHTCIEAYEHQLYPFDLLIEDLKPERDTSRNPLFEIMVSVQDAESDQLSFEGINASVINPEITYSKVDLHFNFEESPDGIKLALVYNPDLYSIKRIERFGIHFLQLLKNILMNPDEMLGKIEIITYQEKQQILQEFNSRGHKIPWNTTIAGLFEEIAEKYPDKPAVVYQGKPYSYSRLNNCADALAVVLQQLGLGLEEPVAILMERSHELIISILAVLKAGGAYLPLDSKLPEARIDTIIRDAGTKILLTDRYQKYNYPVSQCIHVNEEIFQKADKTHLFKIKKTASNLAYILYTSGSTGKPKGSMIEERSVIRLVKDTNFTRFTGNDKIFSTSSISFDATTLDVWGALLNGGTLYLENTEDYLDPDKLKNYFLGYSITKILVTTGLFCKLIESDQQQHLRMFEGLKEVLVGGDRFPVQFSNQFIEAYPNITLLNVYGPTENTCLTTTFRINRLFEEEIPIGKPVSNSTVYILNGQDNLCPIGVPGELCIGGEGISRGYMNRPDLDKKSFTGNPFISGEKIYRTGDLGFWDETGNIHFLGRTDDQLKIRGFRIETGEIENTAVRCKGILQARVKVIHTSEQKQLALYYTSENLVSQEVLKNHLSHSLPEYMIPDFFIELEEFPLNQNGKIDAKALPWPGDQSVHLIPETEPLNQTEKELVKIYKENLNLKHVPVTASFFSLGGQSLKAIKVVSAIQKELSVKISLKEFFASPDIVSLGKIIRNKKKEILGNIPRAPEAGYYELSHAQKRLWVLDKIETVKSSYNIPLAVTIVDDLNMEVLQNAFDDVVKRHEALRTVFTEINGTPFQNIIHTGLIPVQEKELSGRNNPESSALDFIRIEAHQPFSLSEFPLVRLFVIHTTPGRHILFLNIHHIICDGWSVNVLFNELTDRYKKYLNREPVNYTGLSIQYKDYTSWLNRRIAGPESKEDQNYWLQKLRGEFVPLELPADFSRPPVKTYDGESLWFTFPPEIKQKLDAFCAEKRISLFMLLIAALKVLLYRYTSKEDIIIGTPVAGRDHPDLEEQIGCYINTLTLRDRINPQKSFIEFLQNIKETASEAYSHQMYPFDKLVEELKLPRDTSRSPLFDVMVVFQNSNYAENKTFSRIEPVRIPMNISKFDLTFNFNDTNDSLDFIIEFNTHLFRRSRIEQMASHLKTLLEEVMANPLQSINSINILDMGEKKKLLKSFNNTKAAYPEDKTIIGLFDEAAAKYPSNVAVVYNKKILTYAELNAFADRIAENILEHYNVKIGEPIGVLISPSEKMVAVLLAILKAGGAYVPIDPEYPDQRVRHILSESRIKLIITQTNTEARLRSICTGEFSDCLILNLDITEKGSGNNRPWVNPDTTAYVIFTSGSTGVPKGCAVSHRNLVRLFVNDRMPFDFGPDDVWIMAHSYCFDFSVWEMYGALVFGGKLIIPDRNQVRDIAEFTRLVVHNKVTILNQTPGAFYKFIDTALDEFHGKKLNLRYVIFGGDKLNPSKLVKWVKQYPAEQVRLINMYGITETTIHVTYHRLTDDEIFDNDGSSNIGNPLPETRVYILDKALQPVPAGVYGEIYVSGTGLCNGYLNRPDLTAERFIPNPFEEKNLMYKSGDIGRWIYDGTMEYLDRIDNQVQIRGFRVETAEIELHLRRHQAITDAVVVATDKEGIKELAAYLVMKEALIVDEIRKFLAAVVPSYMIPSLFIRIEKIPLTANGKLDKKSLPPAIQNISTGVIFQKPETAAETELLELWHEVLPVENISIYDNFFDIGGNSILLVKLHGKINDRFPGTLSITDLFSKSNISEQAACIAQQTRTDKQLFPEIPAPGENKRHDIAIIGIASRIGSCLTPEEFWKELCDGTDFIKPFPANRIQDVKNLADLHRIEHLKFREYCYLPEVDLFDYTFFKLSPAEASLIDPGQRLFLETACHAMEDAGYGGVKLWGSNTGVFIGASGNLDEYSKFLEAGEYTDPNLLLAAQTPSILASRLSYHFNFKGPALLVDTACSSSLVALHLACQSIREGKIDAAIVGGTKLHLLPFDSGSRMEIDSNDSRAHSFDDSANGTGGGEGVIAVMIKPLELAVKDRDNIYAVIKGSAVNQDGNSNGIMAPDAEAQAEVIDNAWHDAGINPLTVSFIEAHGTGTRLGDPIEIEGINKAFRRYTLAKNICAIGAVKANIGHLDTVAGLAGVLKAVLCLKYKKLPPLVHFNKPNRNINFEESATYINKDLSSWESNGMPLRCGVSSFGLSGTNCHLVLEEAPVKNISAIQPVKNYLFVLSSRSLEGLMDYILKIHHHLVQNKNISPEDLCYTLAAGRGHYAYRLAILFNDVTDLPEKLSQIIKSGVVQVSETTFFQHTKIVSSSKKDMHDGEITENNIIKISTEINGLIAQPSEDLERKVAEAYIKGASINWENYYASSAPARISLPGNPFERRRCWVQLKIQKESHKLDGRKYSKNYEAVFLNHCILDTPATAVYRCIFNNDNWLLDEHRVAGQPTLAGVSYLQIAWEAGRNHLGSRSVQLKDFFLLQPLVTVEGNDLEVLTVVNKTEEILDVSVHSRNENQWAEYARFKVCSIEKHQPAWLNIPAIQQSMPFSRQYNQEGPPHTGEFVQVSKKWNTLQKVWGNENEQLAELAVPHEDESLASGFQLYPPVADGALNFALDETGFLPWSFGTAELFQKSGNRIFSYVTRKKYSTETRTFDITLTDENGQIIARFKDFILKKANQPKTFFHELVWKPWPLLKKANVQADIPVVLFNRHCPKEIINEFKAKKIPVMEVIQNQTGRLFEQEIPRKLIFILPELQHEKSLEHQLNASLYSLFDLAKHLSSVLSSKADLLITGRNVQEVDGNENHLNPLLYSAAGLGQVIGQENPKIRCRFLDIDEFTTVPEILNEAHAGFEDSYYYRTLRKGERFIREIRSVNLNGLKPKKPEDGLYVITGGTGGIGLELAEFLADRAHVKLALLSRSTFPSRDIWDQLLKERTDEKICSKINKIRSIESKGGEIYFFSADVADFDALKEAFENIKKLGPVRGLIHAAGLPGNGVILKKDLAAFKQVIQPKIQGTINLHKLMHDEKPDFFLLTSALTAILPTAGQSDYTAANCFLDAYCCELKRAGLNAQSINLTAWKDTGMAFDYKVADDGVFKSVAPRDAIDAISKILYSGKTSLILGEPDLSQLDSSAGLPFYLDDLNGGSRRKKPPAAKTENMVTLSGREKGSYSDCEMAIASIWGKVLGYTELNIHDNYYDLGGDSIHAIKISSLLEKQNIPVTVGDLFSYLTVAELAAFLESKAVKTTGKENAAIRSTEKKDCYPVSAAQRRLYILDQLTADKLSYHIPEVWEVKGKLKIEILRDAFGQLISRHEILRTSFKLVEDIPVQVIHDGIDFTIPVMKMTEGNARKYIRSFIQPFDLLKAPLFRSGIIEISSDHHLILFDAHHIIMDAFSMELLKKELLVFYQGEKPEPLNIQFKDYAVWQNSSERKEEINKQKTWWMEQFRKEVPAINLPLDFSRQTGQSSEAGILSFAIDETLAARIKKLASDKGVSTFMVLFAIYQLVMHKYTYQEDIIIGVTTLGRNREELTDLLGMFVNNLPIRCYPRENIRIEEFLEEVRTIIAQAFVNQDYPFDELVENLMLKRDMNRSPLFDIVFSYMNFELSEFKNDEIQFSDYKSEKILSSEYDLMLYGLEAQDKIFFTVKYKKALFKPESIERFSRHFLKAAEWVATNSRSKISDIDLLLPDELAMFQSFNRYYKAVKTELSVFDFLKVPLLENPQKTAVICNGRSLTYAELHKKSNQLANHLRKNYSVMFGDRIGIMLNRDENLIVAMLGILKSGAAYVGIDPDYPLQRINYILNDSRSKVLVTSQEFCQQGILPNHRVVDINESLITKQLDAAPTEINTPGDCAYIIYTSGSTGQPKGVVITHKNLSVLLQWCHMEFKATPFEVLYATASCCFDFSVYEIFYPLIAGKTIRVLKSSLEILGWLSHDEKVLINTVPSLLNVIIDDLKKNNFSHLTGINIAGEQIPQSLIDSIDCDNLEIRNLYGPSEDTTFSTAYRFSNNKKKVLIGKPISNTTIFITNSCQKLVPLGHPGEICIAGDGLAKGYLFKEDLTNEKFIKNPFGSGRLYRTGDLGRWTESGDLEYLGRIDRQVKIRGFRVELGEIETHIRRYPGIENAVVIAKENKEVRDIVAYLVASTEISINGLKAYLGKIVPDFMIPLHFVVMEHIPLTPNGKADLRALPDPMLGNIRPPDAVQETLDTSEELLVAIWKEVLGVEHLSKYASFFDLGGHSLKALRLLAQINRIFGQQFVLADVFENPSVARFALFIKNSENSSFQKLTPLPKAAYYEVSHAQRRMWTFNRIEKHAAVYNVPVVFLVKSDLDIVALEKAFQALIRKYESLRTYFIEVDGEPKQVIQDKSDFKILFTETTIENSFVSESYPAISQFVKLPFNLEKAPLIRVNLIKNQSRPEYLLIMNIHHIVIDEWSVEILARQLTLFYEHFAGIKPANQQLFEPSPVQYKEFAQWHNRQVSGTEVHREYWLNQFKEPPPVLDLPADLPRPKIRTYEGKTEKFILPADLSEGLKKLSTANQSTLFMTSLALFHVLFSKYTKQDDIVIGTPIANRDHPDVQEQVGFFLNTLALRNKSAQSESFNSFLNKVRSNTINSFSHQAYPFDLLIDNLRLKHDLSRSPLFDVMLIAQAPATEPGKRSGLQLETVEADYPLSKFDLSISYFAGNDGIRYFFEYNTSLFRPERIRSMFGHYITLVEKILADEETTLARLEIVPDEEKSRLMTFSNGPEHEPENLSVVAMIEKQAVKNADKTALVFKRMKLSYEELNKKANQLAHVLIEKNISPGELVGVMVNRSEWSVIALLAILKAGAVYVPVDPAYPSNRIEYMLNDSQCKLLIVPGKQKMSPLTEPDQIDVHDLAEKLMNYSPDNPDVDLSVNSGSNAYVIYTSGSTGQPKGILGTHRCLLNLIEWQSGCIESNLKILQFAPHSFDVSIQEILFALATGGTLYLIDNETRYNMNRIAELIMRESVEILTMPFSVLNVFLGEVEDLKSLRSLKHLITSGEQPFLNDAVKKLLKKHPALKFHNQYGPSETHVVSSFTLSSADENLPLKVPAGRPVDNTQIFLLNREMQLVPVGVTGDLYIGGYNVANGYLNRPELNYECFVKNPFGKGKLYKTGDLARWDFNGELEFLGRNDQQVKVRGYRIELGEIESCLQKYPDISEAVVKVTGNGENKEVTAYYKTSEKIEAAILKNYLASRLPAYMIPAYFMELRQFPYTPSGKIDLLSLPAPTGMNSTGHLLYVKPESETEEELAEAWMEVIKQEEISVTDNFFEIGGNSIKAIRLMSKVQKRLRKKVSLNLIFEQPTIRQMARIIDETGERLKHLADDYLLINPDQENEVFFMPPGIGYSFAYLEYAKHLKSLTVCGLNFIDSENPVKSMTDILTKRKKKGAYYLFGHSAGGNMAFDVALELQKRGRKLGGIVLLDSYRQLEVIEWSEEEYLNDAVLYIEQNHAEFLEEEIKDAALHKIIAYRRYLNARAESGFVNCPVIQIEATDQVSVFGKKISRNAWAELCPVYKAVQGFGSHMDMLKPPYIEKNARLTDKLLNRLMNYK